MTMNRRKRAKKTQRGRRVANGLSKARLAAMIEEAIVDAYGESPSAASHSRRISFARHSMSWRRSLLRSGASVAASPPSDSVIISIASMVGFRRTFNNLLRQVTTGAVVRSVTGHITERMGWNIQPQRRQRPDRRRSLTGRHHNVYRRAGEGI
jgi:hypothetical protein